MAYVGNSPALKYTTFAVQHFTTSATTGYTLDHAVTNENDIRLVINNVVQQPGSGKAYTATGTVLTLSAATTGSDTMYCVFLGKAVQTVNPGAGSVGLSQLSATGTASSSTFLRGDNAWQDPGGVALATSTNNQVVTVTGADAITGETNFTWNGSTCTIQADSSGATTLVVGASDNSSTNTIAFPNLANAVQGSINYITPSDIMTLHTSSNTEHFRIAADGTLTATDTSIGSNSDSRVKENIADFTYDLAKFKQLQPRTFDWKNPSQHNGVGGNRGFIAQEVQAIDDYWVGELSISEGTLDYSLIPADESGAHKSLTSKLGKKDAMYISVINQLIARIEALEA